MNFGVQCNDRMQWPLVHFKAFKTMFSVRNECHRRKNIFNIIYLSIEFSFMSGITLNSLSGCRNAHKNSFVLRFVHTQYEFCSRCLRGLFCFSIVLMSIDARSGGTIGGDGDNEARLW